MVLFLQCLQGLRYFNGLAERTHEAPEITPDHHRPQTSPASAHRRDLLYGRRRPLRARRHYGRGGLRVGAVAARPRPHLLVAADGAHGRRAGLRHPRTKAATTCGFAARSAASGGSRRRGSRSPPASSTWRSYPSPSRSISARWAPQLTAGHGAIAWKLAVVIGCVLWNLRGAKAVGGGSLLLFAVMLAPFAVLVATGSGMASRPTRPEEV